MCFCEEIDPVSTAQMLSGRRRSREKEERRLVANGTITF